MSLSAGLPNKRDGGLYGGFAVLHPLGWRDYLPCWILIFGLVAVLGGIAAKGVIASREAQVAQQMEARQFWTHLINSQKQGWHEQGDCFFYAIQLRNLLAEQGIQAEFNFVHWTEIKEGPSIHVYLSTELMGEVWIVDNMGGIRRFPKGTTAQEWLKRVTPKHCAYEYLGGVRGMVDYLNQSRTL